MSELINFLKKLKKGTTVCLDYFDTIVYRTVYPEATKELAAKKLSILTGSELSGQEIYEVRARLEQEICQENLEQGNDADFHIKDLAHKMHSQLSKYLNVGQQAFVDMFIDIEMQVEKDVQRINHDVVDAIETARKKGLKLVIVSDFYLGELQFEEMLKLHKLDQYFEGIFVSSEYQATKASGKLFDLVREKLGLEFEQMVMIGDNAHSDVAMPETRGIKAFWTDRTKRQDSYANWRQDHQNAQQSLKVFEEKVDKLYLCDNEEQKLFPEISSALWHFCHKLFCDVRRRHIKDLFFFSKEGEFLKKIFEIYQQKVFGGIYVESHYLIVSRKATFIASLDALGKEDFSGLFGFYTNISPKEFLLSLNISEKTAKELCDELSLDYDKREKDFPSSVAFSKIKESKSFKRIYEERRRDQKNLLKRYINSFGVDVRKDGLNIVDVGWKGSIQNNIFKVLDQKVTCLGYYIGAIFATMVSDKNQKKGVLFSDMPQPSPFFHVYNNNRSFFEIVLGATHGSADGYISGTAEELEENSTVYETRSDSKGDFSVLVLDFPEERKLYKDHVKSVQKCIADEVEKISDVFALTKSDSVSEEFFARKYARMVFLPKTWEVDFYESLYHMENFGVFEVSEFKRNKNLTLKQRKKNLKQVVDKPYETLETGVWPPIILRQMGLDIYRRIDGLRRMKKEFGDDTAKEKIAFLLGYPEISGGTNVIFEHAVYLNRNGFEVSIITNDYIDPVRYAWHNRAHELRWTTFQRAKNEHYDFAIATWWRSAHDIEKVNAEQYVYFVQSIESRFFPDVDKCSGEERALRELCDNTYLYPFPVITEATWIKEYLEENYRHQVELVHNGINKKLYDEIEPYSEPKPGKLRVLLEGALGVPMKNINKTIEICRKSKADEIWLLTPTPVEEVDGVDRVFSQIPMSDTPKVYGSCDAIIKLSYVEGMFGPPLEMFHCGGTAVVYDVTGHDEYIEHGVNALVAKTDDDDAVLEYINQLKDDSELLAKLKEGAKKTAADWLNWNESSARFAKTLGNIKKLKSVNQEYIKQLTRLFMDQFEASKLMYELTDHGKSQLFWSKDGHCSESNSQTETYSRDNSAISLEFEFEAKEGPLCLRFDPGQRPNDLFALTKFTVCNAKTGKFVFDAFKKTKKIAVSGTATPYLIADEHVSLISNGYDPQFVFPAFNIAKSKRLRVSVEMTHHALVGCE